MNIKITIILQAVFLLLAVVAGNMLNNDLADGPRELHRMVGIAAGLAGIGVVAQAFSTNQRNSVKALAIVALVLTFIAASSGSYLSDAGDDYDKKYNLMRASGSLALITAVASLTQVKTPESKPEKKSKE